jgi:hypothetical protein
MLTRAQKIAKNKADKLIEKTYLENCCNVTVNVMDIGKIFAEGHKALAEGRDLKTALVEFVEKIRTDRPTA